MFKLGLTGGIGSGKTSVCKVFAGLGIDIIEADDVSREVVLPGSPCLGEIAAKFGRSFILEDGNLDRARLRERIFSNQDDKSWLESLLHPAIRARIIEKLDEASSDYCILSSPLFFETGQKPLVDRVLVVDVPKEVQLERASSRDNVNPSQIEAIIASQISREDRLSQADDIIDNSGDFDATRLAAIELHKRYIEFASHVR